MEAGTVARFSWHLDWGVNMRATEEALKSDGGSMGPTVMPFSHLLERERAKKYLAPDLLIIDDFGLSSPNPLQTEDFYEIVTERHLKSSVVIPSVRPPQDWTPLFPGPVIANSALDRLAHHTHHIIMDGDSYQRKLSPKTSRSLPGKGEN